jgi:hypothetical protein
METITNSYKVYIDLAQKLVECLSTDYSVNIQSKIDDNMIDFNIVITYDKFYINVIITKKEFALTYCDTHKVNFYSSFSGLKYRINEYFEKKSMILNKYLHLSDRMLLVINKLLPICKYSDKYTNVYILNKKDVLDSIQIKSCPQCTNIIYKFDNDNNKYIIECEYINKILIKCNISFENNTTFFLEKQEKDQSNEIFDTKKDSTEKIMCNIFQDYILNFNIQQCLTKKIHLAFDRLLILNINNHRTLTYHTSSESVKFRIDTDINIIEYEFPFAYNKNITKQICEKKSNIVLTKEYETLFKVECSIAEKQIISEIDQLYEDLSQ